MAQTMKTMQVLGMSGSLAGTSQFVDNSVSLRSAKGLSKCRRPAFSVRAHVKDEHSTLAVTTPATITSIVVLADAGAANALTSEDVTGTVLKMESIASQVAQTAVDVFNASKDVFQQVFTSVKPAVDVATPYVQQTADYAYKSVLPIATDLEKQAVKALQSNGIDTKPALDVAKTAVSVAGEAAGQAEKYIESAQPSISSTLDNVLSSDPLVLATGAGALLLLYFLAPPLLSNVSTAVRGFRGELTAPQALDLLTKQDYVLIDVRSEKEKTKSGVPSLPRNVKNKFLSISVEELAGKLRGQIRNVRKVEAEITALKIASMKRLDKGSNIVIIDSNGDIAKIIAKSLSGLGFKNAWIIADGFDGRRGWVQSSLGTETNSYAEVVPSRMNSGGTRRFFSSSAKNELDGGSSRLRLLPGSSDD
ncbi:calcium sensing receptor, chloroplastic [Physcomitrium patens]|uniref:Rhodanese domain-containing protein n=1 Tax=Physcomitrium patens TaxID=3218 RepID=A0A2K1L285_PHYPA|nr:calcium sensing receptor, chloroplastic-like [Physcomitrium patens]XP_024368871.1 calcium sensing receptor, chloroplastic-like [Physcomitrium patens]PNR60137.1 hypothetical protein PHYPA_002930 [Physcomitrium patens]|eukprot:XP_024368870.1 calcium sensing receptor, chloroplastic-like [Physcomitrella patens]